MDFQYNAFKTSISFAFTTITNCVGQYCGQTISNTVTTALEHQEFNNLADHYLHSNIASTNPLKASCHKQLWNTLFAKLAKFSSCHQLKIVSNHSCFVCNLPATWNPSSERRTLGFTRFSIPWAFPRSCLKTIVKAHMKCQQTNYQFHYGAILAISCCCQPVWECIWLQSSS